MIFETLACSQQAKVAMHLPCHLPCQVLMSGAGLRRCCWKHVGAYRCHVPTTAATCQVRAALL